MGLREDILGSADRQRVPISLPEWTDQPLFVSVMSGTERDAFEESMISQRGGSMSQNLANVRAKLAVRTLVDGNGARIFLDSDADALGAKSGALLQQVFDVARKLNKLSQSDVEDLAKNSNPAPSGDSTSA